jgi:hypothetical protein
MRFLRYTGVLLILSLVGLFLMGISTKSFEYDHEIVFPVLHGKIWRNMTSPDSLPLWYPQLESVQLDSGELLTDSAWFSWTWIDSSGRQLTHPVHLKHLHKWDTLVYVWYLPEAEKEVEWALKALPNLNTKLNAKTIWRPKSIWGRIKMPFRRLSLSYADQLALEALRDKYREVEE